MDVSVIELENTPKSHAEVRELLFLDRGYGLDQGLKGFLEENGWWIQDVDHENIPGRFNSHIHTGVIVFHAENIDDVVNCVLEELLNHRSIRWIAILPKELESEHEL